MIATRYKFILSQLIMLSTSLLFSAEQLTSEYKVRLISEPIKPYFYINEQGDFEGTSVERIREVFNRANVTYEIQNVPWSRAITEQKNNSSSALMIFPLARFKERESDFHWVIPLHSLKLNLYGLKQTFKNNKIDFTRGEYQFVCAANTVFCAALRANNVPEKSILEITSFGDNLMLDMVLRGRAHFFVTSAESLATYDVDSNVFMQMEGFSYKLKEYIAGSTNIDRALVKKLQNAAKELGYSID